MPKLTKPGGPFDTAVVVDGHKVPAVIRKRKEYSLVTMRDGRQPFFSHFIQGPTDSRAFGTYREAVEAIQELFPGIEIER